MRHPYLRNPATESEGIIRNRWDDSEKHKVAVAAFHLMRTDKSLSNMAAIDRAQHKVLKPERQRILGNTTFYKFKPWIEPIWKELEAKEKTLAQAKAKQDANDLFERPPISITTPPETPPAMEAIAETTPEQDHAPTVSEVIEQHYAEQPESHTVVDAHAAQPTPQFKPGDELKPDFKPFYLPQPKSADQLTHPPRKQVHWTDEEKEKLAARVHYLTKNFDDMTVLEALRKAIESELAPDRHRHINTMAAVEWLTPTLERIALDEKLEQARLREEQEALALVAAKERARIRAEAEARETEIERRVAERVESLSFDGLIRAFARKLTGDMLVAVRDELKRGMAIDLLDVITAPEGDIPPESLSQPKIPTPAIKLPKIMIVGLFPNQEADVERAFRGSIDFDFVKSQKLGGQNEGGAAMLRRGNSCDVVLVMSDSAGLDVEQKRKQITVPFRKIAGSSSNLKRWLTGYLNGAVDLYGAD